MTALGIAHVADLVRLGVPAGVATLIVQSCDQLPREGLTADEIDAFAGQLAELAAEAMKARAS